MIEVYNFLDGKNICNIFASLIVEKINDSFPDANTDISVINVRNFFVVKGKTSSNIVLNLSDILREFILQYSEELSNTIRVFDMVQYEKEFTTNYMTIEFEDEINTFKDDLQEYVNESAKNNQLFNLKVKNDHKLVFYDCNDDKISDVSTKLKNRFPDYTITKTDFSNETYYSDRFYGLSNTNEKYYLALMKYITNHLKRTDLYSKIKCSIYNVGDFDQIDNENVKFVIEDGKFKVKQSWLESLVLDLFPFEIEKLKSSINLSDCKPYEEIYKDDCEMPWYKTDLISEIVLL